jgi:hypothetical protein
MLGTLSLGKILMWAFALIFPNRRELARKEIQSNFDVIRLCLAPA